MKIDKTKVKSILFITLNNLGDIVLTTPVFLKLHDAFPEASIDVVTGLAGKEIFVSHPAVKRIETHRRRLAAIKRLPLVMDLRCRKYDLVIDLKNSLLPQLIGARYHRSFVSLMAEFIRRKKPRHKKEEHLAKLTDLGIKINGDADFFMPVSSGDEKYVSELMAPEKNKKVVILNAGSKSHLKRWPAVKFAELGDRLVSELNCKIFLIGSELDKDVIECVKKRMKRPFVDLCCATSVSLLASLMRRSALIVTGDSAPLHIASAVRLSSVALFAPTDEIKYGPLADRSKVITPDIPCRPCNLANCALGYNEGCITQIEVDKVFRGAKEILETETV